MDVSSLIGSLVGAFGGVWLGRYLERHNEAMKWRRDRLLDAYSEFLRAVDLAVNSASAAFRTECDTEEHREQKRIAFEKVAEVRRVSDRIVLLSSNAVDVPFVALTNSVAEVVSTLARCPKAPVGDRAELKEKFEKAWTAFTKSARGDLGIHAVSGHGPQALFNSPVDWGHK